MIMSRAIEEHLQVVGNLRELLPQTEKVAGRLADCLRRGGKILWMGNGGSAADSQHLAAELVGRFSRERSALASVALTTDTSILTAVGNDYGFEDVFSRQVGALCTTGDALVAISTSGRSKNIIAALEVGKRIGAYLLGFSGAEGGDMASLCDDCLMVPSDSTCRIQEAHILLGHIICDRIETKLAGVAPEDA